MYFLNLIKPNVWIASVDLKGSFFSLPVHPEFQKYFKFYWEGKYYQFQGMPNRYGPIMRLFNKQLKPPFTTLRKHSYPSVILWMIHKKVTLKLNVKIMFQPQSICSEIRFYYK